MYVINRNFIQREKKEAMMGADKARLIKNYDMAGIRSWNYIDIVLGPELLLIDACFLINCPKFTSTGL